MKSWLRVPPLSAIETLHYNLMNHLLESFHVDYKMLMN